MKKLSITLTFAFAILTTIALLAPDATAIDKQVGKAVVAADWNKVVELVSPTLGPGADIPSKILMVHACRASNRNNSAERQLEVLPNAEDLLAWFSWADSLRTANPESPSVLTLWADARFKLRKVKEHQDQGVSLPLASVGRAIELDGDFAFAYKVRGDIFLAEHRLDHALTAYKRAVALDSNLVEARFNLAVAYEQQEDYEQAIKEYNEVLKMSPGFAKAFTFRGAVYRELEHINEAIEDCNASLKADPTYVLAHFTKAEAYAQANMNEIAVKSFKDFIAMAPPKFARMARNAQARILMLEEQQ